MRKRHHMASSRGYCLLRRHGPNSMAMLRSLCLLIGRPVGHDLTAYAVEECEG